MKISDDLLFEQTRGLALAIAFLSFVVSGCVSHEAGLGQEAAIPPGRPQTFLPRPGTRIIRAPASGLCLPRQIKPVRALPRAMPRKRAHFTIQPARNWLCC